MDLNQTNINYWNENAFSCTYTSTHLIREPHSKLYDDLHSSWSAGFGGCHDDDDDDDFYDDLLRSWSAGFGCCHDDDDDDDDDGDDVDDADGGGGGDDDDDYDDDDSDDGDGGGGEVDQGEVSTIRLGMLESSGF